MNPVHFYFSVVHEAKTVSLPGYKITQIFSIVQPTEHKHRRLPLAEAASSLAT